MPHTTDLSFHRSSSCRHSAVETHVHCVFLVYFVHIHINHLITTYQSHVPSSIKSSHAFIVTVLTLPWSNTQNQVLQTHRHTAQSHTLLIHGHTSSSSSTLHLPPSRRDWTSFNLPSPAARSRSFTGVELPVAWVMKDIASGESMSSKWETAK